MAFINAADEGLDVDLIGWAVLGVAIAAVVVLLGWGRLLAWTVWRAATVFALLWALGVLVSFVVFNGHVREVIGEVRKLPVRLKLNLRHVAASVQAAQASFFGAFASLCVVTATAAGKAAREEQLGPITGETRAVLKAANVLGDADGGAVARK